MKKIFWVGNKKSDIVHTNDLFEGSVNLYGKNEGKHYCFSDVRVNNNEKNEKADTFIWDTINSLEKDTKFMFYNPRKAYSFSIEIQKNCLCLNDSFLLKVLSDKISCHDLLKDVVQFAPYVTLMTKDINLKNLGTIFPHYNKYIIQSSNGSGGFKTYILSDENEGEIKTLLVEKERYLVSAYITNNISCNFHFIIGENDYIIFPPSKQVLEVCENRLLYRGADFFNIEDIKVSKIKNNLLNIIKKLRTLGYRGIIGADIIQDLDSDAIYLAELNCRFQGSSFLINMSLNDSNLLSLQEINILAFEGKELKKLIPENFQIKYSSIINYSGHLSKIAIPNMQLIKCEDDNLNAYKNIEKFAYLCKDIYKN